MSKFWLLCALFGKSDSFQFSTRKYMQCKEKYVYNFSCSINVTVTSQNGVPSFHLHERLICGGVIYTPKIILLFYVCCIESVKTSIETLK